MPRLIGHLAARTALRSHTGSFALIGPAGVGRQAIVQEWAGARPWTTFTTLAEAESRPDLLQVLDASTVSTWSPFLRPLEDDAFPVAVIAESLPAPIRSRLPIFRVGYLSDAEVAQVLAEQYPALTPRPLIAKLAVGSLSEITDLAQTADSMTTLDRCLVERKLELRKSDPVQVLRALRALCRAILGLTQLPFSETARRSIPAAVAAALIRQPETTTRHEARNLLALFWASLQRG